MAPTGLVLVEVGRGWSGPNQLVSLVYSHEPCIHNNRLEASFGLLKTIQSKSINLFSDHKIAWTIRLKDWKQDLLKMIKAPIASLSPVTSFHFPNEQYSMIMHGTAWYCKVLHGLADPNVINIFYLSWIIPAQSRKSWMYAKLEVGKARYFWARSGKSWRWDELEVGQAWSRKGSKWKAGIVKAKSRKSWK